MHYRKFMVKYLYLLLENPVLFFKNDAILYKVGLAFSEMVYYKGKGIIISFALFLILSSEIGRFDNNFKATVKLNIA